MEIEIKELIEQFNNIELIKVFEIEVYDKRTNENDYVLFDISINENKGTLQASHVGLTTKEEQSKFVAYKSIDLDDCFSIDEHLQQLSEVCTEAIMNSDFYQLVD